MNDNNIAKIKKYICDHPRPFTVRQLSEITGSTIQALKEIVILLLKEDFIKKIGIDKGQEVYLYNKNKNKNKKSKLISRYYRSIQAWRELYEIL